jgi:hypothetical protein
MQIKVSLASAESVALRLLTLEVDAQPSIETLTPRLLLVRPPGAHTRHPSCQGCGTK